MLKQTILGIMLVLLSLGMLACASTIQPVRASGTIYIKADGSIDPPGAPILRNGDLYTFTGNIYDSIMVERNNILVDGAGYTTQGSGIGTGIDLSGRGNVTIRNVNIKGFQFGVYMDVTSHSAILGSNITDNDEGISSYESSDNAILGNNISANVYEGISLYYSSNNNIISENSISANVFDGIYLFSSSDNNISANNISGNGYGISPYYSSNNRVFHNNFVNNTFQTNPDSPLDVWDNGYPSGGNYWSDYNGTDSYSGPYQNETGSDGIGDISYEIDEYNVDHYPLMKPYGGLHDIGITNTTSSKTFVGQGYNVSVIIRIVNYGEQQESFNVTVRVNSTVLQNHRITVASRDSTIITVAWNTSGLISYDEYVISVNAESVPGEADVTDNVFTDGTVTIVHVGDVNGDRKVDIQDLARVSGAFGSLRVNDPSDPRYGQYWHPTTCITCPHTPNADINDDGKVDIADLARTSSNFGWHQ